jgi:hypothetical protein
MRTLKSLEDSKYHAPLLTQIFDLDSEDDVLLDKPRDIAGRLSVLF